jgi:hypothetical protein
MCAEDQQKCVWRSEEEEAAEAEAEVCKVKAKPVPKGVSETEIGRTTRAKAGSAAAPIELDSNQRVYLLSESETGAESDRPRKRTKSKFVLFLSFLAVLLESLVSESSRSITITRPEAVATSSTSHLPARLRNTEVSVEVPAPPKVPEDDINGLRHYLLTLRAETTIDREELFLRQRKLAAAEKQIDRVKRKIADLEEAEDCE